jgi:hypothetical protein
MVTMLTALELSRQLTDAQARILEMIREIDGRDELIGQLQTENDRLRREIKDVSQGLVAMTGLYAELANVAIEENKIRQALGGGDQVK